MFPIAWPISVFFSRRQPGQYYSLPQMVLILLVALALIACSKPDANPASNMAAAREAKKERAELRGAIKKIEPFFKPMGKPAGFDWLASHNEPGQTFDQYLNADPRRPSQERSKIYVLPLGTFTPHEKKIIDITTGYLEAFYNLPVEQLQTRALPNMTGAVASRISRETHKKQILARYINNDILLPMFPKDAAALIALTNEDLFPEPSKSYVFGEASLENRVGVWSLSRLDDNTDEHNFLLRTLKVAAHETGHMFSMRHCTKYECVMSGTNNLAETDRRPLDACPECMAKICWLSDVIPAARYDRLAAFCRKSGLNKEADEFTRKSAAVK